MKPKRITDGIPVNPVVRALEDAIGKESDPFDMRDLESADEYMARKIGESLKAARVAAGLTQAELAAKIGKSEAMVRGVEDGSAEYGKGYGEAVLNACGLPARRRTMKAEQVIDGIPVNPVLPKRFFNTDNAKRPNSPWWGVPFVQTYPCPWASDSEHLAKWLEAWPSGTRYDVYCLDGGAWDRPTSWGKFATLDEAIQCAEEGPDSRTPDIPPTFYVRSCLFRG